MLCAKNKKSQVLKIHRFVMDVGPRFGIILEAFSHTFSYFLAIDFCIDFLMHFHQKWSPKGSGKLLCSGHFALLFRNIFRRSTFGCILVALWLPFGSLWLPFGCPWLSSGSLLVPFGALLLSIFSLWSPSPSFLLYM